MLGEGRSQVQSRTSKDRQIRVFISSTFRDMQAERDHFVKFIFPQLRKLCEERAVTWTEVDLRWGITTEQAAEGKVLPLCLEESRRFAGEIETLNGHLKPIKSETRICQLLSKGFYGRQWLFEAVEKWRQDTKLGVSFDSLKQRDAYRRIRRLQLAVSASLLMALSLAELAAYAFHQRDKTVKARQQAESRVYAVRAATRRNSKRSSRRSHGRAHCAPGRRSACRTCSADRRDAEQKPTNWLADAHRTQQLRRHCTLP